MLAQDEKKRQALEEKRNLETTPGAPGAERTCFGAVGGFVSEMEIESG